MTENKTPSEIPGMDLKYTSKEKILPNVAPDQKKMDKTKKELEKLKNFIVKKYPYTKALTILPPQAMPLFVEEEEIPKEAEKLLQLYMIIPEEKLKETPKIREVLVKELEKLQEKVWLQIKTPVDIWEACMDSKFDIVNSIGMSFPLYDTGFLDKLRVASIHKSLVLQKFEKYVVSYVIAGSLVRGDMNKESDVDVFVIINDTDVKKMPRLELKERLRNIIFQYISEANAMAGMKKNVLNVQPYLLTDFWESVKDAHPVMFTFIRDGVPLYDRGTFLPWKALLRMGKLKPSPEAIDMFMSMGDNTVKRAKKALLDIVIHDIYWSVLTPSQALLMLYGNPPPTPKQVVGDMTKVFYEKEKMLEKKYINILQEIVQIYKDFEHEKVKEVKGALVDKLVKNTEEYLVRLKDLREQIDKRVQEKTIEQIYKDVFGLLKAIIGNKSQEKIILEFETNFVKKGKFADNHLKILRNVVTARTEFKKGKLKAHKVNEARKEASILINDLIEYSQRCDLAAFDKGKMMIQYGKNVAELINCDSQAFLVQGQKISKITNKVVPSKMSELTEALENQKQKLNVKINPKVFAALEKELGDFEILM
ncbi:hypothetical protein HOD88_01480 [archaeon]|jgi:uncharacterized protein (UPF0332 family)/predicted nucleotidyltransferase|nr:hypothetical protein [archaeon]